MYVEEIGLIVTRTMKHDWAEESAQICTGMIQKLGKYASEE